MRDINGVNISSFCSAEEWVSWDKDTAAHVVICRPRYIRELVAAMYHHRQKKIRPVGSGWALSSVAEPVEVAIDLSRTTPDDDSAGDAATNIVTRPHGDYFVLDGGARLRQICRFLWERGFSFPTLGGAAGQALAGAMATGTHGADFGWASVCDAVRALHIVVPGGKEFWIEPTADRAITSDESLENYRDWDDAIEVIRDDDLFDACILACGRLGVVYAALVEVEPRFYQEEETTQHVWYAQDAQPGLRAVAEVLREAAEQKEWTDPLFKHDAPFSSSLHDPDYMLIAFEPYERRSYVRLRWRSRHASPTTVGLKEGVLEDGAPPKIAYFGGNFPLSVLPMGRAAFEGEQAKATHQYFLRGEPEDVRRKTVKDVGWAVSVGRLPQGATQEDVNAYRPLVESAEYFFDAFETQYIDFINELRDNHWGWRAAGYIVLRFRRRPSVALLGLSPFENTVSIEITLLEGFPDGQGTFDEIAELAGTSYHPLVHWGQENRLSAPEIDRQFGARVRRWRQAIPKLFKEHSSSMSNAFTREKGLEYGPAIRIGIGPRTLLWLAYDKYETGTVFRREMVGFDNRRALVFNLVQKTQVGDKVIDYSIKQLAINEDGTIQGWDETLDGTTPAGAMLFRREGVVMGMIVPGPDGGQLRNHDKAHLPEWVTR